MTHNSCSKKLEKEMGEFAEVATVSGQQHSMHSCLAKPYKRFWLCKSCIGKGRLKLKHHCNLSNFAVCIIKSRGEFCCFKAQPCYRAHWQQLSPLLAAVRLGHGIWTVDFTTCCLGALLRINLWHDCCQHSAFVTVQLSLHLMFLFLLRKTVCFYQTH